MVHADEPEARVESAHVHPVEPDARHLVVAAVRRHDADSPLRRHGRLQVRETVVEVLLGIDAEQALTAAVNKFIKRFTETERLTRLNGIDDMKSLGIDELDEYWKQAKAQN